MVKYYAVKTGRKPGIYTSWGEAQPQIKGFSGAKYKSFTSEKEALAFMDDAGQNADISLEYEAYVDGSFDARNKQYGSGAVILKNKKPIAELSIPGNDPKYIESFQIAGEVFASIAVMEWAIAQGVPELGIYYDYQGIASWATGEWQAKKAVSIDYVLAYRKLADKVKVRFIKVKGHSGDTYNDKADELAKKAAYSKMDQTSQPVLAKEADEFDFQPDFEKELLMNIRVGGIIFTSAEIYQCFKKGWESQGYQTADIEALEAVFSYDEGLFLFKVKTKNDGIKRVKFSLEVLLDQ